MLGTDSKSYWHNHYGGYQKCLGYSEQGGVHVLLQRTKFFVHLFFGQLQLMFHGSSHHPCFSQKGRGLKYICSFFLVINPSKLTVLLEFCSQKRSCFSDQIVVAHNYLSFLSRQMETMICSFLSVTNEMLHQHFLYNT